MGTLIVPIGSIKAFRKQETFMEKKLLNVRIVRDRRAVTALEYGLIASLIAVFIVVALNGLGASLATTFNNVASSI